MTGEPLWARLSSRAIRAMPAGRYRAMTMMPRSAAPFAASFPPAPALRFLCDLQELTSREAYFAGQYEPQETALFRTFVPTDGHVIDVGANWGYFTLLSSALTGGGGQVLSLEPQPRMQTWLEKNVALNALTHVRILRCAAAGGEGRRHLNVDDGNPNAGLSYLAPEGQTTIEVSTIAIDSLVAPGGPLVDLVKIDVEGAECEVLQGMTAGLQHRLYRRIMLEWHPQRLAAADLAWGVELLRSSGYSAWAIDHTHEGSRDAAYRGRIHATANPPAVEGAWPHWLLARREDADETSRVLHALAAGARQRTRTAMVR